MDTTKELTHVSLCAGYGGIDIGISRAIGNVRTIAYVEIEAFAVANLVAKMEAELMDVAPLWTNLKTFDFGEFRGKVDILSGGFPCQPFSQAGSGNADEDPRHLWPYIADGIRACRPAIVFLENVEGIVSSKLKGEKWSDPAGTPVLLHVLRELERMGYRATAGAYSASEVGAPHQRNRWFICAVAELGHSECERLEGHPWAEDRPQGREEPFRSAPTADFQSWPSQRKQPQHGWEPPYTIKPPMGGDANGANSRVGTSELYTTTDNRIDELRLLGNGVVPQTAERAFKELMGKLMEVAE